mgnify:CR=1 FL=1
MTARGRAALPGSAAALAALAWAWALGARTVCVSDASAPGQPIEPRGNYAVAVSEGAAARPEWQEVVGALREKYGAPAVVFPAADPAQALPALRRLFPAYVGFVVTPEECGRAFVVAVHRMMRRLDDDPYGDALWGILTGYEAGDALRMARLSEPLVLRRGATSMGPGLLARVACGFASDEADVTAFWTKEEGAASAVRQAVSPDAARALAEALGALRPAVFYTSGHATERDWQVGYNVPGGSFRHERGNLYALATDGRRYPVFSPNPKVYLPLGNCLIGHIDRRDCMATAWLHAGGAVQMLGYTAVTFYGYMGWGSGLLFEDGRLSLAEAFFLSNQALLHELATRFPEALAAMPGDYGADDIPKVAQACPGGGRDALGLLWDRDTVAFYGDPAWVARYSFVAPSAAYSLEEQDGEWTLRVTVLRDGAGRDPKWGSRPFMILFPERLAEIREVRCDRPVAPVVTDRFALVPLAGATGGGAAVTVRFRARPAK